MNYLTEGFAEAFNLIFSFNREVMEISFISLKVATISTTLSAMTGVILGLLIAAHNFWGKKAVLTIFNTLMALPTVVVGLLCYSFLSRKGPLGSFGLLYTQEAMIIGQFILATPIITSLSISALSSLDPRVSREALSLGATQYQTALTLLSEGRFALTAAIIAGFGRVFAEVGISMMIGGNIKGYTRNITTAIALETSKGEFALGLALGIILLTVAFGLNIIFHYLQTGK
ncbi:MAG: ABC transporter permease [bacterium]|nr:ABC transporter permease [bacterium]